MSARTQYVFADLLGKVPKDEYSQRVDDFCRELGITRTHANRYMRATWDKPANMPISKLLKAAAFFGLSVDEIINHPSKAVPA